MLGLYLQAAMKKARPFSAADVEGLQRAPVLWENLLPNTRRYKKYCELAGWQQNDTMHPLYWQVRSLPLQLKLISSPQSPFAMLGLVHISNRVTDYTQCRPDIPCELIVRFGQVFQHRRGYAFEVVVTATQRGKPVYAAVGTYLARTGHSATGLPAWEERDMTLPDDTSELTPIQASGGLIRHYARVSGDYNPIHLSQVTAKLFGFKRAIAHGMWTAARVISDLQASHQLNGQEIDIQFKRPLFLPGKAKAVVGLTSEN
ncbi:MAG: MaoC/PaaZ C-terminal domain-containing protein, partial [Pseudomonadota bacterium]|nr:MaoC/PaaZ C-terminal domain-containing protein [Pseudomonadota bacterium]